MSSEDDVPKGGTKQVVITKGSDDIVSSLAIYNALKEGYGNGGKILHKLSSCKPENC